MSYRSIKRVLGETSLERKCRFLFGACLLVLITGSFWWYGNRTDALVLEQSRRNGYALVDAILALEHWEALETDEQFKPVVKELVQNIRNQKYRYRIILPSTSRKNKPQDELEWQLLDRWEKIGREHVDIEAAIDNEELDQNSLEHPQHRPDIGEYQYYRPIYAKEICLQCHSIGIVEDGAGLGATNLAGGPNLRQGDLMAIIQVRFSDKEAVAAQNANRAFLLVTAIITVFLAMILLYVIVRYVIVKPLKHLRDVSDEISRGNQELRADIQTGDEFEELGEAFNRMLRHMVDAQGELQDLNHNLDNKVDQLAQANMRLYEMNRLKSDFLATVSHELRTPLNSIIGFSDVLTTIDSLDEKQHRYVQNIGRSGRMLLEMINDILDLAKIESGKMEVKLSEFSIDQIIGVQCDMARPLSERKNIDLVTDVYVDLPPLKQDQAKVQQILNNLLSNAIKFTPEGGRITVRAEQTAKQELKLVVSDTGVGISEADQITIFEKFRQGSSSQPGGDAMTREHSGTGLGLSIVKELCRLLGGEVSLASELGKGSDFTVLLPWVCRQQPQLATTISKELSEMDRAQRFDAPRQENKDDGSTPTDSPAVA